MTCKTYIFDLDGTLVASVPYITKTLFGFLEDWNLPTPPDFLKTVFPLGYRKTAEYLADTFHLKDAVEEIYQYFIDRMTKAYAEMIPPKGAADEVIRALKAQGAKMCVLSASPHVFIDPCLQRLGWMELLEGAWTVEDFSKTKGDPSIFVDVAKKMGESPENCCMVEDSIHSLLSAKAAGLKTIGVYEEISKEYWEEMKKEADVFVYDLKEIL